MATKRQEQMLMRCEIMLGNAILHLLNQYQDFYDEPRIVTPQDEIYYGPAWETAVELLRDKMFEVMEERERVHAEVSKRAMRLRRLQQKKLLLRFTPKRMLTTERSAVCA